MKEIIDKLGELFIEYDEVLDEYNMKNVCKNFLDKNDKIIDLYTIIISKYKNNLSYELLNLLLILLL